MNCHVRTATSRRLSLQIGRRLKQREEAEEEAVVVGMSEGEEVDEEDNGQSTMNYVVNGGGGEDDGETDLKQMVVVVAEEEEAVVAEEEDASDNGKVPLYSTAVISDGGATAVTTAVAGDSDDSDGGSAVVGGGGAGAGGVTNVGTGSGTSNRPGNLTPDLHLVSPPSFPKKGGNFPPCIVGRYILLDQLDEKPLYKCVNIDNEQEFTCKIVNNENQQTLALHYRVDSHERLNELVEVLVGERHSYLFFDRSFGDLHSYVRSRRRLKETEAVKLFRQVVEAVQHCHNNGIVLRDLKLRKFVFKDPQRTLLKLETLEDAVCVEDDNDTLDDKHGCPAYVSPEILTTNGGYSGKAADVWSLGVMLYAMLVGRYPFHDTEHCTLFNKIRGGHYTIPDTISSKAKCLIRCLLRHNPSERLIADDILRHPWFHSTGVSGRVLETQRTNTINSTSSATAAASTVMMMMTSINDSSSSNINTSSPTTAAATATTGVNKFGDQMVPDCGIVLVTNKKPTGWD